MSTNLIGVAFGEMELSAFTYYGIIATGIIFIVSFSISSIPLARNLKSGKNKD